MIPNIWNMCNVGRQNENIANILQEIIILLITNFFAIFSFQIRWPLNLAASLTMSACWLALLIFFLVIAIQFFTFNVEFERWHMISNGIVFVFSVVRHNCMRVNLFSISVYRYIPIQFLYLITWISGFLISVYWPNIQLWVPLSVRQYPYILRMLLLLPSFLVCFWTVFFLFVLNLCYSKRCVCMCACAPHERNKRKAHQNESEVFVVWNKVRKM